MTAADRSHRPEIRVHTAAARTALLRPERPGLLGPTVRTEAAAYAAELTGQPALAAEYRALALSPAEALPAAVGAYTKAVTLTPSRAGRAHLQALAAAGFDVPAIVTLAQLVAFVSYEARVTAGLTLLAADPAAEAASTAPAPEAVGVRDTAPTTEATSARDAATDAAPGDGTGFTLDVLTWHPWIEAVAPDALGPEQRAVIDAHATLSTASPYYRTLMHDPAALDHRTHVYNAIMYGRGGLPRAERELATVLVSRGNGCVYCASVHGRKFAQLGRDEEAARRVLRDGSGALGDDPRRAAIGHFAERLTATPPAAGAADAAALRAAGLDDAELADLVHCAALFGWANRLMQVLGEARLPAAATGEESCSPTSGPGGRTAGADASSPFPG